MTKAKWKEEECESVFFEVDSGAVLARVTGEAFLRNGSIGTWKVSIPKQCVYAEFISRGEAKTYVEEFLDVYENTTA